MYWNKRNVLELLTSSALFLLLALVMTWPMPLEISNSLHGFPGDSIGSIYDLWYGATHGVSFFPGSKNYLLSHPVGMQTGGPILLAGSLLYLPGLVLTKIVGEVAAYNILILMGIVLPGAVTFRFFRVIKLGVPVSLLAATLFVLMPYHQLSLLQWYGQSQLLGIPLTAIALVRCFEIVNLKTSFHLAMAVLVSFLTNAYIGLMAVVLATTGLAIIAVGHVRWTNLKSKRLSWSPVVKFLITAGSLGSALYVLARSVRTEIARTADELIIYGLRLHELWRPTPFSRFRWNSSILSVSQSLHGSNLVETSQYLGLSTLLLMVSGLVITIVYRNWTRLHSFAVLLMTVSVFFGMSQGIHVGGIRVPSLANLLNNIAPFWRVYSRFSILIMFGCLIIVAHFLEALCQLRRSKYLKCAVVGILTVVVVSDLLIRVPGSGLRITSPGYVNALKSLGDGVTIEYPLAGSDDVLRYQRRFEMRTLGIGSLNGDYSTDARLYETGLSDPTVEGVSFALQALSVRWVIIQDSEYQKRGLKPPEIEPPEFQLRYIDSGVRVYEIVGDKYAGLAWLDSGGWGQEINSSSLGEWIGKSAEIVVSSNQDGCANLTLNVTPYSSATRLTITAGDTRFTISKFGEINVALPRFESVTSVKITSDSEPIQIPGPDPRSVSAWINSEMRVVSSPCS